MPYKFQLKNTLNQLNILMPILDPSLQYALSDLKLKNVGNIANFFATFLYNFSNYVYKSSKSMKYSINFKKIIINNAYLLQEQLNIDSEIEYMKDLPLNYFFSFLYSKICAKTILLDEKVFYFAYNGQYNLNFYASYGNEYSWFFTDSPIAILSYHPMNSDFNQIITNDLSTTLLKLQIDLISALEFTVVLSVLAQPETVQQTHDFLEKIDINKFAEIHINLEFDKIDEKNYVYFDIFDLIYSLSDLYKGYFYIYAPFFEESTQNTSLKSDVLDKIKEKPCFKVFRFSQSLKKSLKYAQNSLINIKPFAFCKNGFNTPKIRVLLCNVLLYNSENDETDFSPSNESDLSIGYIPSKNFLNWNLKRVLISFCDKLNNNSLIERYIDFEDIHIIRPDFYVKKTLFLTQMDSDMLNIVDDIANRLDYNDESKLEKRDKFKREFEDVLSHFYKMMRSLHSNSNFTLHQSQIFTIFEACKKCISENKRSSNKTRLLYQIETGEGKSYIILLISAILAKLLEGKKVHIASSNILLAKRDYENSFDFFEMLNLKSCVLLHSNELPLIRRKNI